MSTAAPDGNLAAYYDPGERLAALVLDLVDSFLLVANRAAVVAYASSNLSKYLDCTAEQLRQRPIVSLLYRDDRSLLKPYLEQLSSSSLVKRTLPSQLRFRLDVEISGGSSVTANVEAIVKLQQFPFSEGCLEPALVFVCRPAAAPQPEPVRRPPSLPAQLPVAGFSLQPQQKRPTPTLVCELNLPDLTVLRSACSPELTASLGILGEYFLGKQWGQLVAQSDRPIWQRHLDTAVSSSGRPASSIYRCQVAPGRVAYVKTCSQLTGPNLLTSTHTAEAPPSRLVRSSGRGAPQPVSRTVSSDSVLLDLLDTCDGGGSGVPTINGKRRNGGDISKGAVTPPKLGTPPMQLAGAAFQLPNFGIGSKLPVPPNVRLAGPPELPQDVVDTILAMEDQREAAKSSARGVNGRRSKEDEEDEEESVESVAAPSRVSNGLLEKLLS
uniref:PAS domain-containing protein n=1 Tax=Macrostomum lignano TaxID=282301 RepID=A0A1I8HKS3_9PLAT